MLADGLRRASDQPICATIAVNPGHPSRGRESNAVANRFADTRRHPGADTAAHSGFSTATDASPNPPIDAAA
ncbi:MAG TPA: hypothetical protein VGR77_06575 [Candidatus Dormibacteraeota bacterium]|nr:hypothetical protein [Candidatus Dormibacteraeota bacterium]